ncbi:MAG: tetratricopeptide repeat protein [Spirochaetales bacterium]|nr:tetratricopeptide repeat protein [Spirochaetales bacterium]
MQYDTEQLDNIDKLLADSNYNEAVALLEDILMDEPDNTEALLRIGIAFTELNEADKALKTLDYFFTLEQDNSDALEAYGCSNFKLGNYGLAKIFLEKAEALAPSSSSIARNLGVTYNQLGEFKKSYRTMMKSYKLNPWDYRTIYALASANIFFNRYDKAEKLLLEMLQMEIPEDFKRLAIESRKKIKSKLGTK